MDSLTHILLGANLGYLGFGRRLGRTAALAGGLAAFSPDADVFIRSAADPLLAIEYHRGFTHALAFAPCGAAIVAALWLVRPKWRNRGWLSLWLCCLVGYVSHSLLDAATTYGTQLLWPFSSQRTGWDIIAIVDPLFTIMLLAGVIWGLVKRRIAPCTVGLLLSGSYLGFGVAQHARAIAAQRTVAASRGHRPERVEVMPTIANNVVWRALYLHDDRIYSDRVRVGWFSAATVREGWSLPLVTQNDLTAAESARNRHRSYERFAWFSDQWLARTPADPSAIADMRYSLSAEAFDPIWSIRFTSPGVPTDVVWINRSREREVKLADLWREISGRDPRFRALP